MKCPTVTRRPRLTIEVATRAVLRGKQHVPDQADDDADHRPGPRTPKITLPRVRWLEKPGPTWVEPPKPARKKDR
jgi:hypothetical protein